MTRAEEVLALVLARPATLGSGRLVCIDGRAGTGKSTLATEITALTEATVVRTDDLCPGWDGLGKVPRILVSMLVPLAAGGPATYPRYDWVQGRVAEPVVVAPSPLLIIEGLGAGARLLGPWRTTLVWVEARDDVRRQRALDRDGEAFAPYWDAWARAEDIYLALEADRAAADLVIEN